MKSRTYQAIRATAAEGAEAAGKYAVPLLVAGSAAHVILISASSAYNGECPLKMTVGKIVQRIFLYLGLAFASLTILALVFALSIRTQSDNQSRRKRMRKP